MSRTLFLLCCLLPATAAQSAPARFWLSLEDSGALDPGVPQVTGVLGVPRRVHIWAQPQTAGNTTFQNISLNVVSANTGFGIDPNTVEVYNPTYSNANTRFEYVSDSTDGLISVDTALPAGMSRGIANLQGFTFDTSNVDGFGGTCDAADNYCTTTSGSDAWLFASFTLTPTSTGSTAELYLQVGLNGMSHQTEAPGDMSVIFGVESADPVPSAYDPSTDYDVTLTNDDPDAVFTLVKPGDYDADGDVDTDDYDEWRDLFGTTNSAADGNSDGVVDAADYAVWRNNYPMSPAPIALEPVPEPAAFWLCGLAAAATLRSRARRPRDASACG